MKVGNRSVVYGNVPAGINVGDDCVVIGPTDQRGNVVLTGTMAVGSHARAGRDSISFGYNANAAGDSPSLEEVRRVLADLISVAIERKSADSLLATHQLMGEISKDKPDTSVLKECWNAVEKFSVAVGAYDGIQKVGAFLSRYFSE